MNLHLVSLLLFICFDQCACFKSLLARLPNADDVMNPCDPAQPWEGIGHHSPGGFGARNQFGHDFKRHGLVWRPSFCMLDSDGDGLTNGQELGDPDCTWISGGRVSLKQTNVSHPGICEPLEADHCRRQNTWLKCNHDVACEALDEPGMQNVTIRLPPLAVPEKQTTHYCMIFDLPQDGDFHMVATQPFLDNKRVVHHILVYGCDDDKTPKHPVNQPYECEIIFDAACPDQISTWLLGTGPECLHGNTGFRIGRHGYKRAGIQIHWENQKLLPGLQDSSGTTIYYTPNLRPHDAAILMVGTDHMNIPPGEERHLETGSCYPECTRRKFTDDIHVTFAINHMHYLGREMKIEVLRDEVPVATITDDQHYDYDSPLLYRFDTPVRVRLGDEIRTTCTFNATSRDVTTRYGSGYLDEMCFGFLTFYPRTAVLGSTTCTSWGNIPFCRFELDETIDGCEFRQVHNLSHPSTRAVYDLVTSHCRPFGPCYKECRHALRTVAKLPCYHGDIWRWSRDKLLTRDVNKNETAKLFKFYAAIDSCWNEGITNWSRKTQTNAAYFLSSAPILYYFLHRLFTFCF